jgi:Tfp pilus assembly protein PilE
MNNKKGFELIELMVIIVIMGIFAAVAIPKFMGMKCKSDIKACKENDIEMYNSICSQDRNYKICYGKEKPKTVKRKLTETYDWLKEGDVLTEEFITSLKDEEKQNVCNQLNRRTEFVVLRTTYGLFNDAQASKDKQ